MFGKVRQKMVFCDTLSIDGVFLFTTKSAENRFESAHRLAERICSAVLLRNDGSSGKNGILSASQRKKSLR